MRTTEPTCVVQDGVRVTWRRLRDLLLEELVCPPQHRFDAWEPDVPYVAVVLEGAMEKRFAHRPQVLRAGSAITIPVSATHETRFGDAPTRVLKINATADGRDGPAESLLDDLVHVEGNRVTDLGWRLAAELHARDAAAELSLEGLALEALASVARSASADRGRAQVPRWLVSARELLETSPDLPSLTTLADAVGVHPSHLARTFRSAYGMTVGDYARRLRLDRARTALAATDTPIALVAAEAGFADQSHFTRAFKRYTGLTPASYRAARRS